MEPCINFSPKGFTKNDEFTAKANLLEMHTLGILHRDIKPDNIMYSQSYQKYVFIDFGISEFRKEKPG